MLSIFIFIACTTIAFGAPTKWTLFVPEEVESMLQDLPSEAREDYYQIAFNYELTFAEIGEKLVKWAEKYGISEKWTAYKEKFSAEKQKFDKAVLTVIENLPSVYKMIKEITSNKNQTIQEVKDSFDKLEEPYHLEVTLILLLSNILEQNEKAVMNRGNGEIGNEVLHKMRDYQKNGNFKTLLLPGPF